MTVAELIERLRELGPTAGEWNVMIGHPHGAVPAKKVYVVGLPVSLGGQPGVVPSVILEER